MNNATQKSSAPIPHAAAAHPPANDCPTVTSRELFQGSRELLIEHDGCHYRLRQTSKGKLILTK
ncbi:MAG TPA: hemin uptake protein HemP [Burkholderiales bacterium]|nr:hemin uptake protein HemP [Burkholderiales bacterium]